MNKNIPIAVICVCIVLIVVVLSTMEGQKTKEIKPTPELFKELSMVSSCDGIEGFYTGRGFMKDMSLMYFLYNRTYNTEEGNSYDADMILQPPAALTLRTKGYDCEDYAHAISCLNMLYPTVYCEYNVTTTHVGGSCYESNGTSVFATSF